MKSTQASAMKRAFGYCRVSSTGQAAEDRDGLVRQEKAIKEYAAALGIKIVRWFRDSVSGTKDLDNRPALQELLTALHGNGIQLVIIEKLDRLARDLMIQESIIADLRRHDFQLISAMEPDLCSDDPTRVLLRQMMGAFSEYERKMIVQKLRGARQRARASHPDTYREGRKPFGTRAGEQEIIERIVSMRASGMGYDRIGEVLNDEHVPARKGRWHPTTIQRILTRA